jgi:hypothetical protein
MSLLGFVDGHRLTSSETLKRERLRSRQSPPRDRTQDQHDDDRRKQDGHRQRSGLHCSQSLPRSSEQALARASLVRPDPASVPSVPTHVWEMLGE